MLERIFQKDEKFFYIIFEFFKFTIFFISFYIAYKIRFQNIEYYWKYFNLTLIFYIIYLLTSSYRQNQSFFSLDIFTSFLGNLKNVLIAIILLVLILYLNKSSSEYSRIWFTLFVLFNLILIFPYKYLMNKIYLNLIKSNIFRKNVLLIGEYKYCKKILSDFTDKPNYHFRAMLLLNKTKNFDHLPIQEINFDNLSQFTLTKMKISQVWIIYNFNFNREKILEYLNSIPIDIRTIIPKELNSDEYIDSLGGYSFYNTSLSPFFGINYFFKILIDFILALIFLIISSPIILLSALLILIEDGRPIFFKQKRYGWDGNYITIYKLRSLIKDNEPFKQVVKNDNRILKIGKVIRRLSIDELPQFINVLKGEMSLVGPRPHPLDLDDAFSKKIRGFMQRLRCKPGLTGLAQVEGYRGPTTEDILMQKRYELDLKYIKNWSPLLDLKIIVKTMFVFLFQKVD